MNPAEIWALLVAFAITMYAVLDGFDLGVGMLLLVHRENEERSEMLNTIYPTWDGNETWIVLAGVGLFGGFPEAYATLLPALYVPFIVMLLSLIFRGVSLEFRFNAKGRTQAVWDTFFGVASVLIVLSQGLIVGSLIHGLLHPGFFVADNFTPWGFVNASGLLTAAVFVVVMLLHGSNWLTLKANDALRHHMGVRARWLLVALLGLLAFAVYAHLRLPAFAGPSGPFALGAVMDVPTWIALGVAVAAAVGSFLTHQASRPAPAFRFGMVTIAALAAGVVAQLWPDIIPPGTSIYAATAKGQTDTILMVAALIIVPIILTYTAYGYYVFRGPVKKGGYGFKRTEKETARLKQAHEEEQTANASAAPAPKHVPGYLKWLIGIGFVLLFLMMNGPLGEGYVLVSMPVAMGLLMVVLYKAEPG